MTSTRNNPVNATRPGAESPEAPLSVTNPVFEAQRAQWQALLSWQQSLATFNKDFWEQWAVRYAGGMPIDG
jgi:hypothetical protein